MRQKNILIIGANSAIAQSVTKCLIDSGQKNLFLVARDQKKLNTTVSDYNIRYELDIPSLRADLTDYSLHEKIIQSASKALGDIDQVFIFHGVLSDQKTCENNIEKLQKDFDVNFLSVASLLNLITNLFEQKKKGSIVVISSVAGDRGRQSNYIYGAAKAALNTFCQGLRNRLHKSGVQLLTVKPGFVDTPMVAHLKKGFLWASPDSVAKKIVAAANNKKDVLYVPWFWRYIMLIIKSIPEFLFKRLSL